MKSNIAEVCLAHSQGSKLVRAYLRTDLLDQRRVVMDAWGAYVMERVAEARIAEADKPFVSEVTEPGIGTGRSRRTADMAVVKRLLVEGRTVTEISRELDIPRQTVYRARDSMREVE